MEAEVYIPIDRRLALANGEQLPEYASGSVLFADISGFTPMTELLVQRLGPRRGPEALTRWLNQVYDALIAEVHRYRGSVIGFSGDAITCWLDGDTGERATACSLAMQQAMQQFVNCEVLPGEYMSLAMKAAVAVGSVRRFLVGNPDVQYIDVLAGATLEHMAAAEGHAEKGEVVLDSVAFANVQERVSVADMRVDDTTGETFAVVNGITGDVATQPWPALSVDLPEEQVRPWLFRPVYENLQSGQSQFLAEIRPAVPIFLRFHGIDYDSDPDAGAKLDTYVRWIQAILERYGGFLIQLTVGDKGSYLYSAFGAPIAHDDDPLRAVAAALEMQSPPPAFDYIQNVQIGITRGQMRTGAYGSATRYTYGVLGDEVNLAARLMTKSEPGQILVSQRIVNATEHSYEFESQDAIQVKGKSYPIDVAVAVGRKQRATRKTYRVVGPLVGRDNELALLDECLGQSLASGGQIVRIEGGAGMGKSYLAAEFAMRAARRGVQVFPGACQSISRDIPYTPWQQVFRAFFALADTPPADTDHDTQVASEIKQVEMMVSQLNPDWMVRVPLLGDLLGLPIPDNPTTAAFDAQLRQEALFALVIDILHLWASDIPLVLLLEDVHWIDEPSRNLTTALARVLSASPLLLVLVHRPPLSSNEPIVPILNTLPNYHELNLGELSEEAAAAMISHRLAGEPEPLLRSLILAKTQGNPFFTEELVDALRETNNITKQDDGVWVLDKAIVDALNNANCLVKNDQGEWVIDPQAPLAAVEMGIPETVQGAVLSRMDLLPERHRLTLKVASVIGRVFFLNVLSESHPSDVDISLLLGEFQVMESRDFTFTEIPPPQPVYMFKHNVTQEVAYGTLLDAQRQALHRAVAETVERLQPDAVGQLAYHYSLSGVRDKTLFYLDKAARKSQREFANETALRLYEQALALDAEQWEWHRGRVEVLHLLGRRDEEQAALRHIEETVPHMPAFDLAYLWGTYYESIGEYEQAQDATERALAACRAEGQRLNELRCLNQLGMIAYRRGNYEQARGWYAQVIAHFGDADDWDDWKDSETGTLDLDQEEIWALAYALDESGAIAVYHGQFDEARTLHERALALYQQSGNRKGEADVRNSLAILAYTRRNLDEALRFHQQALALRQEIGDRVKQGGSLINLALVTRNRGDYRQTLDYLRSAQQIHQATGNRWDEVNVYNELGILFQELGNYQQAKEELEQGLQIGREIGDEAGQAYILANLGAVMRDLDDMEAAETLLSEGLALAEEQDDVSLVAMFQTYMSMVSLLNGQHDQAIERAERALTLRRSIEQHLETTANLAMLAAAHLSDGNTEQARDYAQQAIELLNSCGGEGPEYPHHDYFICSRVFAAVGDSEASQAAHQSAYRLLMQRAETIAEPDLRQSFLDRVAIHQEIVRGATQPPA